MATVATASVRRPPARAEMPTRRSPLPRTVGGATTSTLNATGGNGGGASGGAAGVGGTAMTSLTLTGLANVTGTQTATGGNGGAIAASFPGKWRSRWCGEWAAAPLRRPALARCRQTGNAVGGNGGIGRGGGFAGGGGGAAGMNPISAVSAGGNVTATANATGGNGGVGNDNATGGAGGGASLIDDVTGTTSGNVTLNADDDRRQRWHRYGRRRWRRGKRDLHTQLCHAPAAARPRQHSMPRAATAAGRVAAARQRPVELPPRTCR